MPLLDHVKPGAAEIVSKRTPYAKTFALGNNQYQLIQSSTQIHYEDSQGRWQNLSLDFVDNGNSYRVTNAPYRLIVDKGVVGYTYFSRKAGRITCRLAEIGGVPVGQLQLNISPRVDGNKIWFDQVVPGVSFYVMAKKRGAEIFKVIHSANAPHSFAWDMTSDADGKQLRVQKQSRGSDNYGKSDQKKRRDIEIASTIRNANDLPDGGASWQHVEVVSGATLVRDKNRVKKKAPKNETVYPLLVDVEVNEPVNADGFARGTQATWYEYYYFAGYGDVVRLGRVADPYRAGFHFATVPIPQGSTIDSANLTISVAATTGGPALVRVGVVLTDDAAVFSSGNMPAAVTAGSPVTITATTAGTQALDVQSLVQTIVDRAGWASNQNMAFIIDNAMTSGTPSLGASAAIFAQEDGVGDAIVLNVTYSAGGTDALALLTFRSGSRAAGNKVANRSALIGGRQL